MKAYFKTADGRVEFALEADTAEGIFSQIKEIEKIEAARDEAAAAGKNRLGELAK